MKPADWEFTHDDGVSLLTILHYHGIGCFVFSVDVVLFFTTFSDDHDVILYISTLANSA